MTADAERSRASLFGVVLTVVVAISFAINSTLASIAYDDGATPFSVLTWRTGAAAVTLFVILRFWKVRVKLPGRQILISIGLGAMVAAYSYGLLGAIEHIPVALAVLTFYLYPILTGIGAWLTRQQPLSVRLVLALLVAFIGLALALDVFGQSLNAIGIAMAAAAAVINATLLVIMNRMLRDQDSRPITFYMLASGVTIYLIIDLIVGDFPLPRSAAGLMAFAGVGVFYSFSIIGFFVGISKIGAVRLSLIMNVEPLSSLILGVFLLGQILSPLQFVGAGMVLAAIIFAAILRAEKPA